MLDQPKEPRRRKESFFLHQKVCNTCPVLNVSSASKLSSLGNHGFALTFMVVLFNTFESIAFAHQFYVIIIQDSNLSSLLSSYYTFPMIPCTYIKLQLLPRSCGIQPKPLFQVCSVNSTCLKLSLFLSNSDFPSPLMTSIFT